LQLENPMLLYQRLAFNRGVYSSDIIYTQELLQVLVQFLRQKPMKVRLKKAPKVPTTVSHQVSSLTLIYKQGYSFNDYIYSNNRYLRYNCIYHYTSMTLKVSHFAIHSKKLSWQDLWIFISTSPWDNPLHDIFPPS
jgi:hypothetical protein